IGGFGGFCGCGKFRGGGSPHGCLHENTARGSYKDPPRVLRAESGRKSWGWGHCVCGAKRFTTEEAKELGRARHGLKGQPRSGCPYTIRYQRAYLRGRPDDSVPVRTRSSDIEDLIGCTLSERNRSNAAMLPT